MQSYYFLKMQNLIPKILKGVVLMIVKTTLWNQK